MNHAPGGPISHAAARLGDSVPTGISKRMAEASASSPADQWHPFNAATHAQSQATQLLALLAMAERDRMTNQYGWANAFWRHVHGLESQAHFSPDLPRLLEAQPVAELSGLSCGT